MKGWISGEKINEKIKIYRNITILTFQRFRVVSTFAAGRNFSNKFGSFRSRIFFSLPKREVHSLHPKSTLLTKSLAGAPESFVDLICCGCHPANISKSYMNESIHVILSVFEQVIVSVPFMWRSLFIIPIYFIVRLDFL